MKKNRKRSENSPNGWVLINKPIEMGSTDCVSFVKRVIREVHPDVKPKVGHAGTLDPLATGVLILALGDATKLVDYVMHEEKTYVFRAMWGEARDTDDAEGKVIATSDKRPTREEIEAILPEFTGVIEQVPPKFSAVKIKGKRAYDLAREGEEFVIEPKEVMIHSLGIISHTDEYTDFYCECGKGTYVRSLARDMAEKLGSCAYIGMLERSRLGKCAIDHTISLEMFEEMVHKGGPEELGETINPKDVGKDSWLVPMAWMLDDIPAWSVPEGVAHRIKHGNAVRLIAGRYPEFLDELEEGEIVQVSANGRLLALCTVDAAEMELKPVRVFNW